MMKLQTLSRTWAACLVLALCLAGAFCQLAPQEALAEASLQAASVSPSGSIQVSGLGDFGGLAIVKGDSSTANFTVKARPSGGSGVLTVASSDKSIASPAYASRSINVPEGGTEQSVHVLAKGYGAATITVSMAGESVSFPVVVYPRTVKSCTMQKASFRTVRVTWEPMPGVTGYLVQRAPVAASGDGDENEDDGLTVSAKDLDASSFETVARIEDASVTSAEVPAPWNARYAYRAVPFVTFGQADYHSGSTGARSYASFALVAPSVHLQPVRTSGTNGVRLEWSAEAGASSFEVQRSLFENSGYKTIARVPATTSHAECTAKKKVQYFYRIRAVYPDAGEADSNSYASIVPGKKTGVVRKRVANVKQDEGYGQYGFGNWAGGDDTYYYTSGSKLYTVCYTGKNLVVYGLNSSLKKVSSKTVKLPKHSVWGGFYHGPDGNNYVAIGYTNNKESKKKTVIKVLKYGKSWKKGKVAKIKGSASNEFEGITVPFDAGAASFDMLGSTLYLHTSREMFAMDGVNHESNIAFRIDTKTMKAREDNIVYVSHSFNQRVRFKDGDIVLADHGDGAPRGINVGIQERYGTSAAKLTEYQPFLFKGADGENFTGATMGGMEVGYSSVLVAGTAQPHNMKVKGVSGMKSSYNHNAYVAVVDRTTGATSVKWLTKLNPKKGRRTVDEVRMVKLTDDRFAVLYSVRNTKTNKGKFHCDIVDGSGKRVSSKTYKNVRFSASTQPVLFGGSLCWSEGSDGKNATFYKIPVLL